MSVRFSLAICNSFRSLLPSLVALVVCAIAAFASTASSAGTIGGAVTGLTQPGLQLRVETPVIDGVSWSEQVAVPNGATQYSFVANFSTQYNHVLSVAAQPPGQFCVLTRELVQSNGGGNITDANVVCGLGKPLGGKGFVTGLILQTGNQQVMSPISGSGEFRFPQYLLPGERYDVWVAAQPASWHCVVGKGSGTMTSALVSNIDVMCVHKSICSPDVDDDGRVLASTDMQIINRVMRGMRGPEVLSGLQHPDARRNNWGSLRDYLNLRCGMALP